jgi:SAM-dependent methyltransferase
VNPTEGERSRARALCAEHAARGDHLGWFETLYREAHDRGSVIPWADLIPNPHLVEWHQRGGIDLRGLQCLKVGCGLGDDAEYLASAGGEVVAFDIAPTAIDGCRRRFPQSSVRYLAIDLFDAPSSWGGCFDFVLESYTLQVLPPQARREALERISGWVAPGGVLLVICRARQANESRGEMPWPLVREELTVAEEMGLVEDSFEEFDDRDEPVRRFRAEYHRGL